MSRRRPTTTFWLPLLAVASSSCAPALAGDYGSLTGSGPRARYEREVGRDRAYGANVAREWAVAGDQAAHGALRIALPFREAVYFAEHRPAAIGYRFTLRRGEPFEARADAPAVRAGGVFLELFEVAPGDGKRLVSIARSDGRDATLRTGIRRAGDYVLLVQPRLGHGGRYRIAVVTGPQSTVLADASVPISMVFPVEGRSGHALGGRFGDPRDGGTRAHVGVDIMAPRGTPVLAAADGRITRVANTPVGGRVIWQVIEDTGVELYYAHLDEQFVRAGKRVRAGDKIGSVGNTGNARSAPPHLHFGVYMPGRRPVDPAPVLAQRSLLGERVLAESPPIAVIQVDTDAGALGSWQRARGMPTPVREAPSTSSAAFASVAAGTPLRLVGGTERWYRVALPDGVIGFVLADEIERFDAPLRRAVIADRTPLREHAGAAARTLETLFGGESVEVLGEFRGAWFVRSVTGTMGWIEASGS